MASNKAEASLMNRRLVTVGLRACLGFSMVLIFAPIAVAKCFPPTISLSATKGERGTRLTVTGQNFWLRCIDSGSVDGLPTPMEPAKNIQILLKHGDQSRLLTTVDADVNLRFSITVTIPANAELGKATFIAKADNYFTEAEWALTPIEFEIVANDQQKKN